MSHDAQNEPPSEKEKKSTIHTRRRFGEIALSLGFIDENQLEEALKIQRERHARGMSHRLIGLILLEMGAIGNAQLIDILKNL